MKRPPKQASDFAGARGVTLIRSARKTVALEILPDGRLLVRAPLAMKDKDILAFLNDKSGWIEKHLRLLSERQAERRNAPETPKLGIAEINALADRAVIAIPPRVKHYAGILGVSYGRITIRNQTTRWGSCSSKGNLNFNCLLMLMPPDIADYVIVHELCHLKEMNHSKAFWALVASVLPDYKDRIGVLKQRGGEIMRGMRGG